MKASTKVMAVSALAALAVAAPATAATKVGTPISAVKASGTVRVLDKSGNTTGFRLSYGVTKKPFLIYSQGDGRTWFHAVTLKVIGSSANAVRFAGIGIVHGKRVPFKAIVVSGGKAGGPDRFALSWAHGAQYGGVLMTGAVHIYLPISHVGYRPATKT
ncbi:MAG TPA: hypothetical protein VHD91_10565 [Gaiellaceae bacterium]|nr:hypothetical protein [Gaiellaceae bacterium]